MMDFLRTAFCKAIGMERAEKPRFVSVGSIRRANAMLMAGIEPDLSPEARAALGKSPITPGKIREAGRVAMSSLSRDIR